MVNIDKNLFEGKSISELKNILKSLKLYKDLTNKLGNRGKNIFSKIVFGNDTFKVQYFKNMEKSKVIKEALDAFKKVFNVELKEEDIIFEAKNNLSGGMRILKNDNLVDFSFKKIENLLK